MPKIPRGKRAASEFRPPPWFKLADYAYIRKLDADGWHRALSVRREFRQWKEWADGHTLRLYDPPAFRQVEAT
jgi:hypothetical protein